MGKKEEREVAILFAGITTGIITIFCIGNIFTYGFLPGIGFLLLSLFFGFITYLLLFPD